MLSHDRRFFACRLHFDFIGHELPESDHLGAVVGKARLSDEAQHQHESQEPAHRYLSSNEAYPASLAARGVMFLSTKHDGAALLRVNAEFDEIRLRAASREHHAIGAPAEMRQAIV